MKDKENLREFLASQRLPVIASSGEDLWAFNVFYGMGKDFRLYFVSSTETKHARQIMRNPRVAFSIAWFNPNDHSDRKAVQGQGVCRIAETDDEIEEGVALHNKYYPEFREEITPDWVKRADNDFRVWVIEPTLKYWDDELFGEEGTREFRSFL